MEGAIQGDMETFFRYYSHMRTLGTSDIECTIVCDENAWGNSESPRKIYLHLSHVFADFFNIGGGY
jgi:hypothetical protein